MVLAVICAIALIEKWWIALRPESTQRLAYASSYAVMGATVTLAGLALVLAEGKRFARYFAAFAEQPARQTALSFIGLAVFGAFLLTLPVSVREPTHVSFIDALFMATSAVCVTGLAVHGVASEYTFWGQLVLLALVQVGGIGIMVLSASLVVLTGRKLRARSSKNLAEALDAESVASLRGNIRGIVLFTFTLEAIGALLLYGLLAGEPAVAYDISHPHAMAGSGGPAWAAIFHAVSAFCNAGFTLTRDSLVPFASSIGVCGIIMALIVLGGLGFPVLSEVMRASMMRARGRRPPRLSLHSRTVLATTSGLLILTAVALSLSEWNAALSRQAWPARVGSALFQSVTLRTAGFNTVDIASLSNAGVMICMMVMFIGASPGSTGGGLKVTTFAVLFATLRAELRGVGEPRLFDRRVPPNTVRRAISVAFMGVVVLTLVILILFVTEALDALDLAFEAVSAFATVGLSRNLTPNLSPSGKLVIIATMLIGRVGPLTVALAASERARRAHHQYPQERVLIG